MPLVDAALGAVAFVLASWVWTQLALRALALSPAMPSWRFALAALSHLFALAPLEEQEPSPCPATSEPSPHQSTSKLKATGAADVVGFAKTAQVEEAQPSGSPAPWELPPPPDKPGDVTFPWAAALDAVAASVTRRLHRAHCRLLRELRTQSWAAGLLGAEDDNGGAADSDDELCNSYRGDVGSTPYEGGLAARTQDSLPGRHGLDVKPVVERCTSELQLSPEHTENEVDASSDCFQVKGGEHQGEQISERLVAPTLCTPIEHGAVVSGEMAEALDEELSDDQTSERWRYEVVPEKREKDSVDQTIDWHEIERDTEVASDVLAGSEAGGNSMETSEVATEVETSEDEDVEMWIDNDLPDAGRANYGSDDAAAVAANIRVVCDLGSMQAGRAEIDGQEIALRRWQPNLYGGRNDTEAANAFETLQSSETPKKPETSQKQEVLPRLEVAQRQNPAPKQDNQQKQDTQQKLPTVLRRGANAATASSTEVRPEAVSRGSRATSSTAEAQISRQIEAGSSGSQATTSALEAGSSGGKAAASSMSSVAATSKPHGTQSAAPAVQSEVMMPTRRLVVLQRGQCISTAAPNSASPAPSSTTPGSVGGEPVPTSASSTDHSQELQPVARGSAVHAAVDVTPAANIATEGTISQARQTSVDVVSDVLPEGSTNRTQVEQVHSCSSKAIAPATVVPVAARVPTGSGFIVSGGQAVSSRASAGRVHAPASEPWRPSLRTTSASRSSGTRSAASSAAAVTAAAAAPESAPNAGSPKTAASATSSQAAQTPVPCKRSFYSVSVKEQLSGSAGTG